MKLSPQAIREFKDIYLKKRGVELTDNYAESLGIQLLQLADLLIRNKKK